ncbi:MAG: hypothetical protein H0U49_09375 [Parachlamydiaceae bacterium]|nr:hypothetical protein [Parachlamydiaceae bacterium]
MGVLDSKAVANIPVNNQPGPALKASEEKETWGRYFTRVTGTTVTGAISFGAGWQASAVAEAWIPKLVLDAAVNKYGFIKGGMLLGPGLVKLASPLITLGTAGTGMLASALAGLAIVGTQKAITAGVGVVADKIEKRGIQNGQRKAQFEVPATENDMIAVDNWDELINTPADRIAIWNAALSVEKSASSRGLIAGEISKEYANVGIESFRRNLDL